MEVALLAEIAVVERAQREEALDGGNLANDLRDSMTTRRQKGEMRFGRRPDGI